MELNLELKLTNIYGGDGITRPYQVESVKLSRSTKQTRTRVDVGVPVESELEEEQTEVKDAVCQTFKRDQDGAPMLRLGGTHGKLWGALKEAAESLKDSEGLFNSYAEIGRFMRAVRIFPIYVRLEEADGMMIESLPQILAGRRASMIQQFFDVIPCARAKVRLVFPDVAEKKIKRMLDQLKEISCLNKRRGSIELVA
jgi:hypothetical protein